MAIQASRASPRRRFSLSQIDQGIVEVQRHQRGGNMAGETFDDDADLLHVGLDIVGGHETIVRFVRQSLRGHGNLLAMRRQRPPPGRQYVSRPAVERVTFSAGSGGERPAVEDAARPYPRSARTRGCAMRRSRRCIPCAGASAGRYRPAPRSRRGCRPSGAGARAASHWRARAHCRAPSRPRRLRRTRHGRHRRRGRRLVRTAAHLLGIEHAPDERYAVIRQ